MSEQAMQVPLIELLRGVPQDARLVIENGPYSTSYIPVGRYCQEAAAALSTHHAAPGAPQQPLPLEFIDDHIGADEGDREAVIALVREVEAAHGITARTAERKPADFPTIRVRRASEEALMRQADDDGRFLNAQGHQQAIDAIDFCLAEFSRAAATAPAGGVTEPTQRMEVESYRRALLAWHDASEDEIKENIAGLRLCLRKAARILLEHPALTTAARAAEPAIHLGAEGQKVFAETLLNPPPPTAAFLKAEESYSNLVRPEATAPAGGMTDGAERWMAIVREKADDARKNAHGLRQFEGMEAEARARELAAQYLLETAHVMVLDERHAEALAGIVDQSGRIAELRAALTTAARAAEPADFEAVWSRLPIPGEYDAYDAIDQRNWKEVVRMAFERGAAARAAETESARLWNALIDLPGARRRIWNHVIDDELKAGHNSIESVLRAASPTQPTGTSKKGGE